MKRWTIHANFDDEHGKGSLVTGPMVTRQNPVTVIPATAWDAREEQLRGLVEWCEEQVERCEALLRVDPTPHDPNAEGGRQGARHAYRAVAARIRERIHDPSTAQRDVRWRGVHPHDQVERYPPLDETRPGLLDKDAE